jgi:hypothetical protein
VDSQAVLPQGTYWTPPLTRPQLLATMRSHGYATTRAAQRFFKDLGPFSSTVRFGIHVKPNGIWDQFEQRDGGRKELGWSGAYHAKGADQMTVLGYGCTVTYGIHHLAGGAIGIRVLSDQGPSNEGLCGPQDLVAQTAIYETAGFRPRG